MKTFLFAIAFFRIAIYSFCQPAGSESGQFHFACSFQCDNSVFFLQANCNVDPNWIRTKPISPEKLNPYDEFNSVIATLKDDKDNPFRLSYSFRDCNSICNAVSIMLDSLQIIFYNPDFLDKIDSTDEKLKWAVRSIIAHEIGHQILQHTAPRPEAPNADERRKMELQADFFSGFVIKQFPGASLSDAKQGILSLDPQTYFPATETEENSADYPTIFHRLEAVEEGFQDRKEAPLRIAMFAALDSIAFRDYLALGKSTIFHEIDMDLAAGNFIAASEKLRLFRATATNPAVVHYVDQLKNNLLKGDFFRVAQQRIFSKEDIEKLSVLKTQLGNGTSVQKKQAEAIEKLLELAKARQVIGDQ